MILMDHDHNGRKRDQDLDTLEYKNAMRKMKRYDTRNDWSMIV